MGKYTITTPPPPDFNGHDYVDLGLPSGTLWATKNVGANKPTEYGLYFQWGDTIGYTEDQVGKDKQFTWGDYKWSINGSDSNFSKYTTTGATLELEDDAVHANMGGSWHMPTPTQIQELLDNTTFARTPSDDDVSGVTFTSKKDSSKSIYIPGAGEAYDGSILYMTVNGIIWSSMLDNDNFTKAISLYFWEETISSYEQAVPIERYYGLSVRGVIG